MCFLLFVDCDMLVDAAARRVRIILIHFGKN